VLAPGSIPMRVAPRRRHRAYGGLDIAEPV